MGLIWIVAAAAWGVAEATVFFIVPDVIVTCVAVRFGLRAALKSAFVTAVMATIAGMGMWWWGAADAEAAREAVLSVPAIGPDLLVKAHGGMAGGDWAVQLFLGALTGTPYKLYAVEAGALHIDPWMFAALSIPARLLRLVITASLAALGSALFERWGIARWRYPVLAAIWIGIYATYWVIRA